MDTNLGVVFQKIRIRVNMTFVWGEGKRKTGAWQHSYTWRGEGIPLLAKSAEKWDIPSLSHLSTRTGAM